MIAMQQWVSLHQELCFDGTISNLLCKSSLGGVQLAKVCHGIDLRQARVDNACCALVGHLKMQG